MIQNPIRLLIAEDHTLVAQGYEKMFADRSDFTVVGLAGNYRDIIHQLQAKRADVLVLDLSMPFMQHTNALRLAGFEVLEYIKANRVSINTLIVSNHRDYEFIRKAMHLGADGYVLKSAAYEELLKALMAIATGSKYLQPEVKDILHNKQEDENRDIHAGVILTQREKDILNLLGEGLTTEEMMKFLQLKKDTINEYRQNLIRKFNARNAAHLVKIACDMNLL